MGLFGKRFGNNTLKMIDADFDEIESVSIRGSQVIWQVRRRYLDANIKVLIGGDKTGISEEQKRILHRAIDDEAQIKSESATALKEHYNNADFEFISIEKHFNLVGMSVNNQGFELSFQETAGNHYFFNVCFENNQCVGVSIDG